MRLARRAKELRHVGRPNSNPQLGQDHLAAGEPVNWGAQVCTNTTRSRARLGGAGVRGLKNDLKFVQEPARRGRPKSMRMWRRRTSCPDQVTSANKFCARIRSWGGAAQCLPAAGLPGGAGSSFAPADWRKLAPDAPARRPLAGRKWKNKTLCTTSAYERLRTPPPPPGLPYLFARAPSLLARLVRARASFGLLLARGARVEFEPDKWRRRRRPPSSLLPLPARFVGAGFELDQTYWRVSGACLPGAGRFLRR